MKKSKVVLMSLLSLGMGVVTLTSCGSEGGDSFDSVDSILSMAQAPAFGEGTFSYDKNVGHNFEIPLKLYGSNIVFVKVNEKNISSIDFEYDFANETLVLFEKYMLGLEKDTYDLKVITDSLAQSVVETTFEVTNSLITSFDENNERNYEYGKMKEIKFECHFGSATIESIKQGDRVIPSDYYKVVNDELIISHEAFDNYSGEVSYVINLSNKDTYNFTISTNVDFFTDYDITTEHDDTVTDKGLNSLYQYNYNGSVSIIDGTDRGFIGQVLKYIPNREQNPYDANGIYTLQIVGANNPFWYQSTMTNEGTYLVSFDYMTVGSTVGTFKLAAVAGQYNGTYSQDLLIGEANNDTIHHFDGIIKGSELGNLGIYVYALWQGGAEGAYALFDNFRVTSLDTVPELGNSLPDYEGEGDYTFNFKNAGYDFQIFENGTALSESSYTYTDLSVTLTSAYLKSLANGNHTFTIKTPVGSFSFDLFKPDTFIAILKEKEADYVAGTVDSIKLHGDFHDDIEIVSVKQKDMHYLAHTDWVDYYDYDLAYEFKDMVALTTGKNGYVTLSKDFLDRVNKSQEYEIEFNNGQKTTIKINSNRMEICNYDDKTISGEDGNGVKKIGSHFASGLWKGPYWDKLDGVNVKERTDKANDKAVFIEDTMEAEVPTFYTVKLHDHVWGWYQIDADKNKLARFEFDYKLTGFEENEVYFKGLVYPQENIEQNFFGDGHVLDNSNPDGLEVRWYLNNDGEVHHLDTGWFVMGDEHRLFNLVMPRFTGKELMLDNFAFSQSENPVSNLEFLNDTGNDFSFPLDYTFESMTIDGNEVEATQSDKIVTVNKQLLEGYNFGKHSLVVNTTAGAFKGSLFVTDSKIAKLTETNKAFDSTMSELKFAGEFDDTLQVAEVKKFPLPGWTDDQEKAGKVLNSSDVTIANDGIIFNANIISKLYNETRIEVLLSNGKKLSVNLSSDKVYYTDFTNTTVWDTNAYGDGNARTCQDTRMTSIEHDTEKGVNYLLYQPKLAQNPWATGEGTKDNGIFTLRNSKVGGTWEAIDLKDEATYKVDLVYEVVGAKEGESLVFIRDYHSNDLVDIDSNATTFSTTFVGGQVGLFSFHYRFVGPVNECTAQIKIYSYSITEVK